MAAVEDPLTGPPKSLLLMISRSLPTIKFMTSYEKRFKCARSTHSKRPRRAPACGPKERPQPFTPLHCTHCSTKDPFSRRFTKHDYFYAHRIILYVSIQIEKLIHMNKYVSNINLRVERLLFYVGIKNRLEKCKLRKKKKRFKSLTQRVFQSLVKLKLFQRPTLYLKIWS